MTAAAACVGRAGVTGFGVFAFFVVPLSIVALARVGVLWHERQMRA